MRTSGDISVKNHKCASHPSCFYLFCLDYGWNKWGNSNVLKHEAEGIGERPEEKENSDPADNTTSKPFKNYLLNFAKWKKKKILMLDHIT